MEVKTVFKRRAAAVVLCLVAAGSTSSARSRLDPPPLDEYHRWGALRARPGFELANVGYDSNILSSSVDEVGDFTATVFGRLDGLVLFGSRGFLTFSERFGYKGYLENSDQSYPIQRGSARATVPFSRIGVFGEIELNRDRLSAIDLESVRPVRKEDGLAVGVIIDSGWRTELQIARRVTRWRFTDPDGNTFLGQTLGERLDRTSRRTQLDVDYLWRGRTKLTLAATLGTIDFASPAPLGQNKDSDEWSIVPGIDLGKGGKLSGNLELGWQEVLPKNRTIGEFKGVVSRLRLAYRFGGRLTLGFRGNRQPFFTVGSLSPIGVDTQLGVQVLYYFHRFVGLDLEALGGVVTFPETEDFIGRRDVYQRHQLGLRFRVSQNSIGRQVEYRLKYVYYYRVSNLDTILPLTRRGLGMDLIIGF